MVGEIGVMKRRKAIMLNKKGLRRRRAGGNLERPGMMVGGDQVRSIDRRGSEIDNLTSIYTIFERFRA